MILRSVFIRFYKSFNYDYLRKYDRARTKEREWEKVDGLFYPFVRVPIDEHITTVVGANESGKSQLLSAIEKGISGERIKRDDFCRYSQFFSVEKDKLRWPDFGFEWRDLTSAERTSLGSACGIEVSSRVDHFILFRMNRDELVVYLPREDGYARHSVTKAKELNSTLPSVFRLKENIALPESSSIRFLAGDTDAAAGMADMPRLQRAQLMETVWSSFSALQSKEGITNSAETIAGRIQKVSSSPRHDKEVAEQKLAYDLIRNVAQVDATILSDLATAISESRDAFANSIIDKINEALDARLNFPQWWVQDREFRLLVSPRDFDLAFTIRDRTGKEYAFGERSSGLRYFLSYYVQYLAHDRTSGKRELLLMDEPDAYLSSQGQQDLLKIFQAFAFPELPSASPTQVIYVTHSPFLIDKNNGARIRVLEKGVGEEGTRVVGDASRNHYEPLRSAFGSFVGETTFIGNCNLIVEGPADQILLAGAAAYLRSIACPDLENLDLNRITIVPAGGASHVPYLVYLARGRDVEKPAVIVLLDSDKAGSDARKGILKGGPRHKQLLAPDRIAQIGDVSIVGPCGTSLVESEDLVPLTIIIAAVQRYLREVCESADEVVNQITPTSIRNRAVSGEGVFTAIEGCLASISTDLHIEKIGLARAIIQEVGLLARDVNRDQTSEAALQGFISNTRTLFRRLRKMQRDAERELTSERVSGRVNRAKSSFLQDHPLTAKREHAFVLFEEIESSLDNSLEADSVRNDIQALRREFKIEDEPNEVIEDFTQFRERLEQMRYASRLSTQLATLQELTSSPTPASVSREACIDTEIEKTSTKT